MTQDKLKIEVQSEIGKLNAVLLHRPGAEVENMTPNNVQRALYSDILNLSIAQTEYEQLYGVLSKVAKVHEVRSLLINVLDQFKPRADLIKRICETEDVMSYYENLMMMKS
jgi:arginine deiminase